jgi:hypothetical protein
MPNARRIKRAHVTAMTLVAMPMIQRPGPFSDRPVVNRASSLFERVGRSEKRVLTVESLERPLFANRLIGLGVELTSKREFVLL